jgi:hypothetical protein
VWFCFAALPSSDYVVISPSRNSIVILPSRDNVVITPSCDSIVLSPLRDSVVISPSCDSIRIGCLNTILVLCMRWFPYGAWFLVCCVHLSFVIGPEKMGSSS